MICILLRKRKLCNCMCLRISMVFNRMCRFLQCEPQFIDAAWVSSQSRPRLFWGNLLTLQNQQFINNGPNLQHYLNPGRKAVVEKLRTVTTRTNSLRQGTISIWSLIKPTTYEVPSIIFRIRHDTCRLELFEFRSCGYRHHWTWRSLWIPKKLH